MWSFGAGKLATGKQWGGTCEKITVFVFQVNSVNCNTSWKIVLFMKWSDNKDDILKGVSLVLPRLAALGSMWGSSSVLW